MVELIRVGETTDILGECPTWSPEEGALYWIDVRRPALHRFDTVEHRRQLDALIS